ncbi:MAG: hypothetical protein R3F61_23470 [Myxococcota bacterium]
MWLAFALLSACGTAEPDLECGDNPVLAPLLRASDAQFDDLLLQHGPVEQVELPCIVQAATGRGAERQARAAGLLVIAHGDRAVIGAAQRQVFAETDNVVVWAKLMEGFQQEHADDLVALAGARPELVAEAIAYTDASPRLQARVRNAGLRAGVLAGVPGIEATVLERIGSSDADEASVALDAMPATLCAREKARLVALLDAYEAGAELTGLRALVFRSTVAALVRASDPEAWERARQAVEVDLVNHALVNGARPELLGLRNELVTLAVDPEIDAFAVYLAEQGGSSQGWGLDVGVSRVTLGRAAPTEGLVRACVRVLEEGDLAPDPRARNSSAYDLRGQKSCEALMTYLETGQRTIAGDKHGSDALPAGRAWLEQHGTAGSPR